MGLMDFIKKGEKKPVEPVVPAKSADTGEQTYTVKSGDSLSKIAKKYYGDPMKYTVIYEANKALIGDNPNLIHPGQVLTIPKK
jgi:nucleoid-associated protein YgaU